MLAALSVRDYHQYQTVSPPLDASTLAAGLPMFHGADATTGGAVHDASDDSVNDLAAQQDGGWMIPEAHEPGGHIAGASLDCSPY